MYKMGYNIGTGFNLGIESTMGGMDARMASMISGGMRGVATSLPVNAPSVYNNRTVNMGGININNGMDMAIFKKAVEHAMRESI